jgi:imidazolonepropionase-like amidohydrolase
MSVVEAALGLVPLDTLRGYPELKYLPMAQVKEWTDLYEQRIDPTLPGKPVRERAMANRRRLVKALSDNGVRILFGTDSPQLFNVPGFSIHREIGLMARAGLTPYEILRSATKNVGEYFRDKDKFGTITVGSRADLILLEKNPLKGVANIANPLGVMVRGRWLSQEDIRQKLTAISQQPQQKPANESA